jgi:hypothetical protein
MIITLCISCVFGSSAFAALLGGDYVLAAGIASTGAMTGLWVHALGTRNACSCYLIPRALVIRDEPKRRQELRRQLAASVVKRV